MEKILTGITEFISYFVVGNIFEKGYVIFVICMFMLMFKTFKTFRFEGGKKKLEFILENENRLF